MVFDTLRVGFPKAHVTVYDNAIGDSVPSIAVKIQPVFRVADEVIELITQTDHSTWIEQLIREENEPFYLCDTDIVFWGSVEELDFAGAPLAGRLVPRFFDSFTNCITLPRLHTSLLYVDPVLVRQKMCEYFEQFPATPFNPRPDLIRPKFFPVRNPNTGKLDNFFHDVCCLLYQVVGGTIFRERELDKFDHLNFGTISDVVAPHYPEQDFREAHFVAFENPSLMRGNWRKDDLWYRSRAR